MAMYNDGKLETLEVGRIYENGLGQKIQISRKDDRERYMDGDGVVYNRLGRAIGNSNTLVHLCKRAAENG